MSMPVLFGTSRRVTKSSLLQFQLAEAKQRKRRGNAKTDAPYGNLCHNHWQLHQNTDLLWGNGRDV